MSTQFNVFLDTNVFIKMKYNFLQGPLLRLKRYCDIGIIRLFTNDIVIHEVEKHICTDVNLACSQLRNNIKKFPYRSIFIKEKYQLLNIDFREEKWDDILTKDFHEFLKETKCYILKNDRISINDIFTDYFSCTPPFEERTEKKHEFPDAVIIKSIQNYTKENKENMLIISEDQGWKKAFLGNDKITIVDNIKDTLIQISDTYGTPYAQGSIEYLTASQQQIVEQVIDQLNNLDWTSTYHSNMLVEIDEIDDAEIEDITPIFNGFEYIDQEEAYANFRIFFRVKIEFFYNDYSCSVYDKEDGTYYNVLQGSATEWHEVSTDCQVSLSCLNNEIYNIEECVLTEFELSDNTKVKQKNNEIYD